MSKVNPVNNLNNPIITPKNTGYAATIGIISTAASAYSKNKDIRKFHKFLGFITAALTLLHIGIVKYLHHKYKKM